MLSCLLLTVGQLSLLLLLLLQAAEECVDQEQSGLKSRTAPKWALPFTPSFTPADKMSNANKVRHCCCCCSAKEHAARCCFFWVVKIAFCKAAAVVWSPQCLRRISSASTGS
jgi:hypothetical protein